MNSESLSTKYCDLNRQQQQKIDLFTSFSAGSFVMRTRSQVKAAIERRTKTRIARASRRANR